MKRSSTIVLLLIATCCPFAFAFADPDHAAFDRILRANVKNGRVDYVNIQNKNQFDLMTYLDHMALADVGLLGREAQLAYYINVYNASVMAAVIDRVRNEGAFDLAADDRALFKDPSVVRVRGGKMSLDDLEKTIRSTFKEPRVCVALASGARGGPPILERAYRGEDLNETLDASMKRILTDPQQTTVDAARRKIVLPKYFETNADDFGGRDKLPEIVAKYREAGADLSGYAVEFRPYDWTLNLK